MSYRKHVQDGYIIAVGTSGLGVSIAESEYSAIMSAIRNKPQGTATTDYRLREDLTWEAYEIEPIDPTEEDVTAEEIVNALEEIL